MEIVASLAVPAPVTATIIYLHTPAASAGIFNVSSGLAHAAVSSNTSCKTFAATGISDFIQNPIYLDPERSIAAKSRVATNPVVKAAAITSFAPLVLTFLAAASAVAVTFTAAAHATWQSSIIFSMCFPTVFTPLRSTASRKAIAAEALFVPIPLPSSSTFTGLFTISSHPLLHTHHL